MEYLSHLFAFIRKVIKYHKSEIAVAIASTFIFFVLMFPSDDLSDMVASQIANNSNKAVFLDFENMAFALPLGLKFYDVKIETQKYPAIKADRLRINQSIVGALGRKPDISGSADGIFGGELDFKYKLGKKVESGSSKTPVFRQNLSLEGDELKLKFLKTLLTLPFVPNGTADMLLVGEFDPTFKDQPDFDADLSVTDYKHDSFDMLFSMGFGGKKSSFPIPGISAKKIRIRGQLAEGKFTVEELFVGQKSDPLTLKIKPRSYVNLSINPGGQPRWGSYDLTIDLTMSQAVAKDLGILDMYLGKYKKPVKGGNRYLFRMTGSQLTNIIAARFDNATPF